MKIPSGFIEVTGIGTLRPILIRVDLVISLGWMWRCPDAAATMAMVKKIHEEGADDEVVSPPEDAIWWTLIATETGGTFNVVESVEEVSNRMFEAMQTRKTKWPWRSL